MASAGATADVTAETLGESTSEGTFGTGANSARIGRIRPYETPAKTKMSTPVGIDLSSPPDGLGVLAFRGIDAAKFLQGQLSANVETLGVRGIDTGGPAQPARSRHRLARSDCALLPTNCSRCCRASSPAGRSTAAQVRPARKVVIEERLGNLLRARQRRHGATRPGIASLAWGDAPHVAGAARIASASSTSPMRQPWRAGRCADIAEGLPQVYAATSEAFVAQMLNLDLLGAIAFDKGCYTGQEVIARAHYRGRVKRRLQRWHATAAAFRSSPRIPRAAPTGAR